MSINSGVNYLGWRLVKPYCVKMFWNRLLIALAAVAFPTVNTAEVRDLAELDRMVVAAHPETMYRIVTSIGRPDDQGLIGRNRDWGGLYSVRFQYGAGRAFRYGTAINDADLSNLARYAIDAGLNTIQPDGAFPASLPETVSDGRKPSVSDQASAAAFFLSDVCPALLVAGHTLEDHARIRFAIAWLEKHEAQLLARDRGAPNRLLINALAFGACGQLLQDADTAARAAPFIDAALTLTRNDGVFIEAGGSDTSYQAVNLVVAIEISALGVAGNYDEQLHQAIQRGGQWLAGRLGSDGALDSLRNTRTCANEEFLGRPKAVNLREVFRALAYSEAYENSKTSHVTRFEAWLMTTPEPCAGSE